MSAAARHQSPVLDVIGQRVREARLAGGLTQRDLAVRACISRESIANLERGDQDMPVTRLWLIARLLGISLASLVEAL